MADRRGCYTQEAEPGAGATPLKGGLILATPMQAKFQVLDQEKLGTNTDPRKPGSKTFGLECLPPLNSTPFPRYLGRGIRGTFEGSFHISHTLPLLYHLALRIGEAFSPGGDSEPCI